MHKKIKYGISSFTYAWAIGVPGKEPQEPMSIYQLIEKAAQFKVPILQVADNLSLANFSSQDLWKIKNFAKVHKVQLEVGARGMTYENLEKHVELAVFFSSPILRFVIDGPEFHPGVEEVHGIIKEVLPLLERKNIVLALENHERFKAAELLEIVKEADSDKVGICLDPVNSLGAGEDLETLLEKLAPFIVNLHIKEFVIKRVFHQMGFVVEGCPLGQGMLPLKELMGKIPDRCGSAILEQWVPPEKTLEKTIEKEARWAEMSIKPLKNILL